VSVCMCALVCVRNGSSQESGGEAGDAQGPAGRVVLPGAARSREESR